MLMLRNLSPPPTPPGPVQGNNVNFCENGQVIIKLLLVAIRGKSISSNRTWFYITILLNIDALFFTPTSFSCRVVPIRFLHVAYLQFTSHNFAQNLNCSPSPESAITVNRHRIYGCFSQIVLLLLIRGAEVILFPAVGEIVVQLPAASWKSSPLYFP